jgi:hypothetical protein
VKIIFTRSQSGLNIADTGDIEALKKGKERRKIERKKKKLRSFSFSNSYIIYLLSRIAAGLATKGNVARAYRADITA